MKPPDLIKTREESLEGTVDRVIYSNPSNDWSVARLQIESGAARTITIVGRFPDLRAGERLHLEGEWLEDPKYGRQFKASSHVRLAPRTLRGIKSYLGSGLVPGIGPTMAARLVDKFGLDTLKTIDNEPERLAEVDGIGPVRALKIREAWGRQKGLRDTLIFLSSYGISGYLAGRIYRRYGDETMSEVRRNPFRLATDVHGIGFKTADQIAASLGMAPDSPERAEAGVLFALDRGAEQGHVFLPRDKLEREAVELLGIRKQQVREAVDRLQRTGRVKRLLRPEASDACYRPDLLAAEAAIAQTIQQWLARPAAAVKLDMDRAMGWFEQTRDLKLAPEQQQAVAKAVSERILVITGGPGTGKTTLVRAIVEILQRDGQRVLLAAPTGRAANRLTEATGSEAKTLHRLLEFDPGRMVFQRTASRPLEADVVIVDEASMIDCVLASHLLPAIPQDCRLVLVGDVDQLPSVGPGLVLSDLISSGSVPVVRLHEIFRQAARSLIVANAHRIRRGRAPEIDRREPTSDFFFFERSSPEEVRATLLHLVTKRIPEGFGLDPLIDIQVLTPMRKGLLGADDLNLSLQELLNPGGEPIGEHRSDLRIGDRVMQVRNNYSLEVFNGEVGRALEPSGKGELRVAFDERIVRYEAQALDELTLAYACTVHKAQGSEYPCIVMPVHTQHYVMLQRNLLYTAVTRAQRLAILVGSREALTLAVNNDRTRRRFTYLAERLRVG